MRQETCRGSEIVRILRGGLRARPNRGLAGRCLEELALSPGLARPPACEQRIDARRCEPVCRHPEAIRAGTREVGALDFVPQGRQLTPTRIPGSFGDCRSSTVRRRRTSARRPRPGAPRSPAGLHGAASNTPSPPAPSSRRSHARALTQSRRTVRSVNPSARAVSRSSYPAKKRHSTT